MTVSLSYGIVTTKLVPTKQQTTNIIMSAGFRNNWRVLVKVILNDDN